MNVSAGPWGGNGGATFDDGKHDGVREITIVYEDCINSIKVVYDRKGKPFMGGKHGGDGGSQTVKIRLNYPEEFLRTVSGHICAVPFCGGSVTVVRSLTFCSNLRTLGPYGVRKGTPFNLVAEEGHIVGMFGKSGWLLDSIGFRVQTTKDEVKNQVQSIKAEVKKQVQLMKDEVKKEVEEVLISRYLNQKPINLREQFHCQLAESPFKDVKKEF